MKYFLRKTVNDFHKWCRIYISNATRFVEKYEKMKDSIMLTFQMDEYFDSQRIISQYEVLKASLNEKQNAILEEIINDRHLPIISQADRFDYQEIYNNWLEICFPKKKSQTKELDPNEFGLRLRIARIKKGYSIKQISDLVGLDQSTIKKYELGYQFPRFNVLYRMLQIYEISIDEIIKNNGGKSYEH